MTTPMNTNQPHHVFIRLWTGKIERVLVVPALLLAGCSAFTPASNPTPGRIPVHVVAGTHATGSTADPGNVQYTGGVDVVFGRPVPWYRRALGLFCYGPLTAEDIAFWDADLRREAASAAPRIGVVHYPGEEF